VGEVGLTLVDICDIVYGLLLAKIERQTLSSQQQYVTYRAAGWEMSDEMPTLDGAREHLDEWLESEPVVSAYSAQDRELLELMGVGRG
jgi:hypothetical protein